MTEASESRGVDFLTAKKRATNIVTNPPYNAAEGFVKAGHRLAKQKFALLPRLAFLEGVNRQKTIFRDAPPSRVWVFSERITFYPPGVKRAGGGTTAYAWFVWDKASTTAHPEIRWLPSGLKAHHAQ